MIFLLTEQRYFRGSLLSSPELSATVTVVVVPVVMTRISTPRVPNEDSAMVSDADGVIAVGAVAVVVID